MRKLFYIILALSSPASLLGQSVILENYIQEGLSSNLSLKSQNLELEKALKGIDVAKTHFYPRVNFAPNYSVAFGGRKINIPIGDLLNPVYSTLNHLTGTQVFPQVENASEQLAPMNFHDTKFEIKAPIFNTDIKYNVVLQKDLLNTEKAKKTFLEFEIRKEIETAYYRYLQTEEVLKIYENNEEWLVSYVKLNERLVRHEQALKDVLLSSEYELSKLRQQKVEAENNQTVAKAYFNFLLNRDLSTEVTIDTVSIKNTPPLADRRVYVQTAMQNRPEFEQLRSGMQLTNTLIEMQEKNRLLPQAYIGTNAGFQGFGYKFANQAYMVGQIGLNWPIFNSGEKKLKIQQTKIDQMVLDTRFEEAKKQVEMQVFEKYQKLQSSLKKLDLMAEDLHRTKEVYRLVESRYKNGTAIFLEINKAQNDYLTSQLAVSLGRLEARVNFAELKKVSGIN